MIAAKTTETPSVVLSSIRPPSNHATADSGNVNGLWCVVLRSHSWIRSTSWHHSNTHTPDVRNDPVGKHLYELALHQKTKASFAGLFRDGWWLGPDLSIRCPGFDRCRLQPLRFPHPFRSQVLWQFLSLHVLPSLSV